MPLEKGNNQHTRVIPFNTFHVVHRQVWDENLKFEFPPLEDASYAPFKSSCIFN